jgi:DNA-directed RNA polymerase specialized sigma24 family protein
VGGELVAISDSSQKEAKVPRSSGVEWTEVARELRRIGRILAVIAIQNQGSQRDQIRLLDEMGFLPSEIAKIVGTTPNTVSVYLHDIRRRSRRKANSKGKVP